VTKKILTKIPDQLREKTADKAFLYKAIQVAVLLGVYVAVSLVTYAYFTYQGVYVGGGDLVQASPSPSPSGPPPPPIHTFALLGHGSPGHQGGLLTDSIMIIKIDTGLKKIGLISVPRDSWLELPSHGWEEPRGWKVNAAYAIGSSGRQYLDRPDEFKGEAGGGQFAKHALEQVVGFPIDYFVALDFTGFEKSIDVLGGVDVFVARTFEDPFYPIPGEQENPCEKTEEQIAETVATLSAALVEQEFPCRYETLSFERGTQHLDGETALKFVRSRHAPEDGGDFNRARRQRSVLLAVRDKVLAIDFIPKIIPFLSKLTYNMKTDLSLFQINEFLNQRQEFLDYEIVGIPLTSGRDNVLQFGVSGGGQSILRPRAGEGEWQQVHRYLELMMTGDEDGALRVATESADLADETASQ
jgi:LCP family protein required for cell wall assembly